MKDQFQLKIQNQQVIFIFSERNSSFEVLKYVKISMLLMVIENSRLLLFHLKLTVYK